MTPTTGIESGLACSERFVPDDGTLPNGCHICEVDLDPDTGQISMLRYTIEDDVGKVINPLLPAGQIVGGVAQGLGQTLGEQAVCAGRRRAHMPLTPFKVWTPLNRAVAEP